MNVKSVLAISALLLAGALALQGCGGLPQGSNEAAEDVAENLLKPAPDLPKPWVSAIDLSEKTPLLDYEYVIPPEAAARKVIREWMMKQAARLKAEALQSAQNDEKSSREGGFEYRQHSDGTRWAATADTKSLMSFQGQHYFYTGGAHPMTNYLALIYDRQQGKLIRPADMFADPVAAYAALTPIYCKRLDEIRLEKRGEKTDPADMFGGCPKLREATILPVSTTPKRIDKLRIILDPYVAGPYAEGEYVIELPVDQPMIDLMKREYQGVFITR